MSIMLIIIQVDTLQVEKRSSLNIFFKHLIYPLHTGKLIGLTWSCKFVEDCM